jgi:hypothetical protein
MKQYKEWSPEVRKTMYAEFLRQKKSKTLPDWVEHEGPCGMCGEEFNTMPHAEEYGPTVEEYFKSLHVLCGRCHAMLHLRYRFPGHWAEHQEYVKDVKAGIKEKHLPIKNMNTIFQASRYWKQISKTPIINNDGEWWEQLTCER